MLSYPSLIRSAFIFLLACSGLACAEDSPALETPPKGLATSDWSGIRAAYEAERHAAHRQEDGTLTAPNPGQKWHTEFDGKGFTVSPDHGQWTWGLELTACGGQPIPSASSTITHEGGKISCQRDTHLTEWFINDSRGLEQGWTIQSKSAGASPASTNLTLTLALRGNLKARISADPSSVSFLTQSGTNALSYSGLKAWDADGKNLAARFEDAGKDTILIVVDDRNARYPITIDPLAQQAYLKAGNTDPDDFFGTSVAVSGDTVVVGAVGEASSTTGINSTPNETAPFSGAAYVFVRSGGTWSQQAYLKASNTGKSDSFGISVAVSGDTLVVGAKAEDSGTSGVNKTPNESASDSGAAYVFVRSGGTWSQQAYLKASNTGASDRFGESVAVSGDTVVVGAIGESSSTTGVNSTPNNSAATSGAAYVFVRSGVTWSQQAYLKASNTGAIDYFGVSVAVNGDTLVVGASGESSRTSGVNSTPDDSAPYCGAAYVFTRSGVTWSQQAYLKASNPERDDYFGNSVAVSGDTVAVSAPYNNGSQASGIASDSGSVYVFVRSSGTWSQQAFLRASNAGTNDAFGCSLALSEDTLVVGALGESSSTAGVNSTPDESAFGSGAAYVFGRSGSTWSQQAYLKSSNPDTNDNFGHSVAVVGNTIVVGALYEDSSTTGVNSMPNESARSSGAAYVFDLPEPPVFPEIAVEQAGSDIANGATKVFGPAVVGTTSDRIFNILNTVPSALTLTGTPIVGVAGSSDFTVTVQPASLINGPSGSSNFTVRFTPTGSGVKTASLSIANNDTDESAFVIELTGTALSFTTDSDNDGLNDASEFNMAVLGFNWQIGQRDLVDSYYNNANGAGLYTASQVQSLRTSTPHIARDPATGRVKLTMDWKKSTNLTGFLDFPAPAGSAVSITPQGDVEFEFPSTDDAAFFRMELE